MPRPVTLFTGQWADLPLETLAKKASAWGFDGLELACWGDHFDVGQGAGKGLLREGKTRPAGEAQPEMLRHQHPPGRAVRLRRSHRRSPQGHSAAAAVGRRQARGRAPALRRGGEEDREGREAVRGGRGQRFHRELRVGQALLLPAHEPEGHRRRLQGLRGALDADPGRLQGPGGQVRAGGASRPRSPTTSSRPAAPWRRSTITRPSASTSIPATSSTSSSTRWPSSRSSPTASSTATSRIRACSSPGATASSAPTWTSATRAAAGTSSRRAGAT